MTSGAQRPIEHPNLEGSPEPLGGRSRVSLDSPASDTTSAHSSPEELGLGTVPCALGAPWLVLDPGLLVSSQFSPLQAQESGPHISPLEECLSNGSVALRSRPSHRGLGKAELEGLVMLS